VSSRDPELTSGTDVLPLVYNALESDHGMVGFAADMPVSCFKYSTRFQVQERALKAVPSLCDSIDYAEVQAVLFPRVAVSLS
jgi:SCY1-like protein 2